MQKAIIACGCFWGPEEKYRKINGISSTEVGYCGGDSSDVSCNQSYGGGNAAVSYTHLTLPTNREV